MTQATLSPPRSAAFADLASRLKGKLAWDDVTRCLYASSASIVEVWPQAVLTPVDANDVAKALSFCAEHDIPVTCRGAGSGVVGQSLGRGLIIDFSVHMHRLLEVNTAELWVRVEPGLVKGDLDQALGKLGLMWPPDPSSAPWCTVGAMIANNSGGSLSIRYGTARDWLIELELLDAHGERFLLRPVEITQTGELRFAPDAGRIERRLGEHAYRLLRANRELLRTHRPQSSRCSSGYNLFQPLALDTPLADEPGCAVSRPLHPTQPELMPCGAHQIGSPWMLDMPRLFCGSEGTLAVLLSAKIRITQKPRRVAGASFSFANDEAMARGVVELLAHTQPAKLELLDRSIIDVAARADPALAASLPAQLKSVLIAEYFGDTEATCADQVDAAIRRMTEDGGPAFAAHAALDPVALEELWKIRKVATPILSRVKGNMRPTRWVEDLAVPPWKLPQFLAGLKEVFARHGFEGALFGHAGEGNLHVNPRANPKDADTRAAMRRCAEEAFALVRSLGGVISGEHGDGSMRSPYLAQAFGPVYPMMEAIKREWDPEWLLNPLSKVPPPPERVRDGDHARDITSDLRFGQDYHVSPTGTSLDRPELIEEIEKCHGCGKCRVYCPLMRLGKEEKYTARAKANLLRAVISGKLNPEQSLPDAEFKEHIDLCINCGQCLTECPTQVDIPEIAKAFREQYVTRVGDKPFAELLADPARIGRMATVMPALTNAALGSPLMRQVVQRLSGIDHRRNLPHFRKSKGLKAKPRLHVPASLALAGEVTLFPGCWANYNDPDGEKQALLRILEALGITVTVPELKCCGISKVTAGYRAAAARDWQHNVEQLVDSARRGIPILFSAPSCFLAAKHDLPRLVETEAGKVVAEACVDAHAFLLGIFSTPELRRQLKPVRDAGLRAAYHSPCHSRVTKGGDVPQKLVALIPQAEVIDLDAGCCGLSGSFGMKTETFDKSMAIGAKLFGRIAEVEPGVVFTPCGVCQTQIMQGAPDRAVIHPLRLLYEALP